jgi:pyridoxamine 5'-phosphate oxidase
MMKLGRIIRSNCKSVKPIMDISGISFGDGRGEMVGGVVPILSWRDRLELSMSKIRDTRGSNYVQIATVDNDNLPSCRTVVFRGLLKHFNSDIQDDEFALQMITDARSEKIEHLAANPYAELVWWMPLTSEQYRFSSRIDVVSSSHTDDQLISDRLAMWEGLSDAAREQFYWPDPGAMYTEYIPSTIISGGRDNMGVVVPPPDNFFLLLAYPSKVKYVRLTDNFSLLDSLTEGGKWHTTRVNS